jgi:hypothetical protein
MSDGVAVNYHYIQLRLKAHLGISFEQKCKGFRGFALSAMYSLIGQLFIAFMLAASSTAWAAPVTFDFAVDSAAAKTVSYAAANGWSVLVSAGHSGANSIDDGSRSAQSWQGGGGIGAVGGSDAHTVDNANGADYLKFQFQQNGQDRDVQVTSVTVSCVGCDFTSRDADASWRAGGDASGAWTNADMTAAGMMYTFNLSNFTLSNYFLFGASRENLDCLIDSFKVNAITFLAVQPVPEPSSLAVLVAGALMWGFARVWQRRRFRLARG